jgi:hypothetical protein
MMKFILIIFSTLIATIVAFSPPIIRDTRTTGTLNGKYGDFCEWERIQLWPNDSLNEPEKCRILTCLESFDISITPCPFDITGRYIWMNQDKNKLYPDCCGDKVDTYMQAEFGD